MNNCHDDLVFAVHTAREWILQKPVFLDTETTGLDNTAQICELAVIDHDGTTLIDTLVKPTISIPTNAQSIHHINDEDVADAPGFVDILPQLADVLDKRTVLIYNADYDLRMLRQSAYAHDQHLYYHVNFKNANAYCAMELYAQFYGERNDYGNYRWQKLADAARQCSITFPPNLHRARADAELTRQIVHHVARTKI